MSKENTRRVKLHRKYRALESDWRGRQVPWLNVSGLWLEQAGFNIGDEVEIIIENNLLTIKNLRPDGDTRD